MSQKDRCGVFGKQNRVFARKILIKRLRESPDEIRLARMPVFEVPSCDCFTVRNLVYTTRG